MGAGNDASGNWFWTGVMDAKVMRKNRRLEFLMLQQPILLTNDDGYDAPGLKALWDCVKRMGFENVRIAAPARGWSVRSHATTVDPQEAIRIEPLKLDGMAGVVIDGFPADCSRVGLVGLDLFGGQKPLVLAGINGGANLGIDAYYSGTLAAAREAVALGFPAIALSLLTGKDGERNWERTSRWAAEVLGWLIPHVLENGCSLWNVNFPSAPLADPPPVQVVPMSPDPLAVAFRAHSEQPDGLSYAGPYFQRPARPGTDVEALFSGVISITPMKLDVTDYELLEGVKGKKGS